MPAPAPFPGENICKNCKWFERINDVGGWCHGQPPHVRLDKLVSDPEHLSTGLWATTILHGYCKEFEKHPDL